MKNVDVLKAFILDIQIFNLINPVLIYPHALLLHIEEVLD